MPLLVQAGTDSHEPSDQVPDRGTATVELLTDQQAGELWGKGVSLTEHALSAPASHRVAAAKVVSIG